MKKRIIDIKIVGRICSNVLLIVGLGFFASLVVAIIYEESVFPFIFSILLSVVPGLILKLIFKKRDISENKFNRRNSYFVVTLSWFLLGFIGTLPYVFSSSIDGFTNALFESISGFTTTGSSILVDIESLPKSILFWRSLTHWIGGIGIIVLVIVIMPNLMSGGYKLFTMESSLQDKFKPRIRSVGYRLLFIYIGLTVAEVLFLLAGNMSLYESVCHSFGTVATGGFSPKNTSIADYSPYIQYVIMSFMLLAGINFVIHYYMLHGRFKKVIKNDELKLYLSIVFILGLIIGLVLFFNSNVDFEMAMRESYFQVISIVTCTGFASADYLIWPKNLWVLIFFAMFLGGSTGSTAGGIKILRHLIVFKNIKKMFLKILNPKAIYTVKINKKSLDEETNTSVLTFVTLYILVYVIGVFALILTGVDNETSLGAAATTMAGIGPGIGTAGPVSNFAHFPQISKYILMFLMILGRLEIYTVLILFSRSFRRGF
ncbi:MAG TPA: TrkH family potassium uptake protein [Bacteroidales bacterium]|nr:TrkH family potassium uptake protein [Bacteroidales bacterium]